MVPGAPRYHPNVVQLPRHAQHYPDKLLPHRLEEYVLVEGAPTQNRVYAIRVSGQQVLDAVLAAQKATGLANIDPRYYVGTCFHEAGCVNEWDTEVASPSCPPGFVSVGAYQIGQEEAERFGFKLEDMLDLEKSTECMVHLAEANRAAIRAAAKLANDTPDPAYGTWIAGAMRAYLAAAHNHGVGFIRQAIANWGIDWDKYRAARPTDLIVAHGYGQDCITGGPYWPGISAPAEMPGSRTLRLGMSGEDVRELQRHLKIDADGSFGPKTEAALKAFQASHGLEDDGVCGEATWPVVLAA